MVETKRGHRLGWVIGHGSAESNTGVPELIDGQSISRMLTALRRTARQAINGRK